MPRPFASTIELAPEVRSRLEALLRAGSTPQSLASRTRIVLRAAQPDDPSNQVIAEELGLDRHTVGRWRERFLEGGLDGLQDAPRPGRPRRFSPR